MNALRVGIDDGTVAVIDQSRVRTIAGRNVRPFQR